MLSVLLHYLLKRLRFHWTRHRIFQFCVPEFPAPKPLKKSAVNSFPAKTRRPVFGVRIAPISRAEIVEALLNPVIPKMGLRLLTTINLDHVVNLRKNEEFRQAYDMSWLTTADGMPVYLYARLMGVPIPERVTGADLFCDLLQQWGPSIHRLFFVVSCEAASELTRKFLAGRGFSSAEVEYVVPPFGFEADEIYGAWLLNKIIQFKSTHLIFGVGSPKSEVWILRHRWQLGDMYVLAVGASIEFAVGLKIRSPLLLRQAGLEWLWRFFTEPKRLFRRYFINSWSFAPAILADIRSEGRYVRLQ